MTGLYTGAACRACNLARAMKKQYIPLFFFHNGKNYDMHLVVKEITKKKKYGCVCLMGYLRMGRSCCL